MPDNDYQPPKQLSLGKTQRPGSPPPPMIGRNGQIGTNWSYANFSRRKKILIFSVLAFPYTLITVACFGAGNKLVGLAFVGLGIFVAIIAGIFYLIEKNDF